MQSSDHILVSIDDHQFFVCEQQARILAFLAGHNLLKSVLGIEDVRFFQVIIDGKGESLKAKITTG